MIRPILPTGYQHGRLTVRAYERDPNDPSHPHYRCECACGAIVNVQTGNLPRTHSCGCIRREQVVARSTTHGMSSTPEFKTWAGMIDRCSRFSRRDYKNYGGRGIRVCQRWLESFEAFYADMGQRPSSKHSIDRINNAGDYAPDNCRWATASEQALNRRPATRSKHR